MILFYALAQIGLTSDRVLCTDAVWLTKFVFWLCRNSIQNNCKLVFFLDCDCARNLIIYTTVLLKKQLSGREARWLDLLADFDMTISHKPGRENIADPISRALLAAPVQLLNESQASATLATAIGEFCQDSRQSDNKGVVRRLCK